MQIILSICFVLVFAGILTFLLIGAMEFGAALERKNVHFNLPELASKFWHKVWNKVFNIKDHE